MRFLAETSMPYRNSCRKVFQQLSGSTLGPAICEAFDHITWDYPLYSCLHVVAIRLGASPLNTARDATVTKLFSTGNTMRILSDLN
jgi:hypothetical protein